MLKVTVLDHTSGNKAEFAASADEPLLDQLERECPFAIPNLCWMGACGTCALRVAHGMEHLDTDAFGFGATMEVAAGYVLPCAAAPTTSAVAGPGNHRLRVEVA